MTVARFWTITNSEVVISPPNNPGNGSGGGGNQGGGNGSGGGPGNGNGNPGNGGGGRGKGRGPGGNNGGGGSGVPTIDYSYSGVHPILVADYTNGVYGHGPGGATAPTLSFSASDLFLANNWGRLTTAAEARLSLISGTGCICYSETNTVVNTGNDSNLFAAYNELNSSLNSIKYQYYDGGTSDRFRLYVTTGGLLQMINNTPTAGGSIHKFAGRTAANNFRYAVNGTLGTADTSGTVPPVQYATINANDANLDTTLIEGTAIDPLVVVVWATTAFSDADLQALTNGTYAPA